MINFINKILDKILSNDKDLSDKNFLVLTVLLILIGLNLLGIDIQYLSQQTYILATLIIVDILITVFLYPITSTKLNIINESIDHLNELEDIVEDAKEEYDLIKSIIYSIKSTVEKIQTCSTELAESVKGIPNIKVLKLIIELRTKGLWNEIFKESLKYLLTYSQEYSEIINNNFKNSLNNITKQYIDFVHQNIKIHNLDEKLSADLKNKINITTKNIINEVSKDRKLTEKLYTISLELQTLEDDINLMVLTYLRSVQSNLIL